jgi:plastocyanin
MTTISSPVTIALVVTTAVFLGCGVTAPVPPEVPTAPAVVQQARALPTSSPIIPPTVTPLPGFTPEATQRNDAGVPLPAAPGAHSVVVTYTPVPNGITQVKSGFVTVSVGDNYFFPTELRVTAGTIVEWAYDGGGGETEATHNVISLDKIFSSGDLNPGTRWSFSFMQPGEFAYVCSYHARQMTGKIIVQ